jgi:exopolysaccharide production protein ExoY
MLFEPCETELDTSAPRAAPERSLRLDHSILQRVVDISIAFAVILFCLPLLVVIAMMIVLEDGGPPIYWQMRIGRGGRPFKCYKFRSMVVDADQQLDRLLQTSHVVQAEWALDQKLRNDPRITKLGGFLRRSSLDELPQFFNVLEGKMSVVGPRPIVESEISRYGRNIRHYVAVRPGITGLWQVSGRSDLSYRRRVALDTLYFNKRSFWLNLKILLATVPVVLMRRGSY